MWHSLRYFIKTSKVSIAIIVAIAGMAMYFFYMLVFEMSIDANQKFIDVVPSSLRRYYLDRVFSVSDESCLNCRFRLVSALDALEKDAVHHNSYEYDATRVFPFLKDSEQISGGFTEPISATACNIILLRNDKRLFLQMQQAYRNKPLVTEDCVFHLVTFKDDAARYQSIRRTLESLPSYGPVLERTDNVPQL